MGGSWWPWRKSCYMELWASSSTGSSGFTARTTKRGLSRGKKIPRRSSGSILFSWSQDLSTSWDNPCWCTVHADAAAGFGTSCCTRRSTCWPFLAWRWPSSPSTTRTLSPRTTTGFPSPSLISTASTRGWDSQQWDCSLYSSSSGSSASCCCSAASPPQLLSGLAWCPSTRLSGSPLSSWL